MGSATAERAEPHTTITVFLPVRLREAIEELAAHDERSLSGQVRVALAEHLKARQTEGDTA
jgi:hypothetical protein